MAPLVAAVIAGTTVAEWLRHVPVPTVAVTQPALAASEASMRPSLAWVDDSTGETVSRAALVRLAAHVAAWESAALLGVEDSQGVVLVIETGIEPLEPLTASSDLVALAEELDDRTLLLVGPASRAVSAYLCSVAVARALHDAVDVARGEPLEAMLAQLALDDALVVAELDVSLFDQAVEDSTAGRAARDDTPCVDHVVVLDVADLNGLRVALTTIDTEALVFAFRSDAAVILAEPVELLSIYVQVAAGEVVVAASATVAREVRDAGLASAHPEGRGEGRFVAGGALAIAGPAASISALLEEYGPETMGPDGPEVSDSLLLSLAYLAGEVVLDTSGALFAVPEPTRTRHLVVGSRLVDGASGTSPAVMVDAGDHPWYGSLCSALVECVDDDLARLFRYDRAVAEPVLGRADTDIVNVGFWTPEFCTAVIRLAEAADAWSADADDPVPGSEVSLVAICPPLFAHIQMHVSRLVLPALRLVWPEMAETDLHDAFVIKYAVGPHAELRLHHDIAQISGSVRLNSGFVGGELEFPRQGWDNGDVPVGTLTVWPSLVTHPHRARPVESGVKYGLTLWWRLPHSG
jgi:hypothetical protein